ncbi:MAG: serine hydrolase [Flavisolibacter sp.]|nr:serine hydrolase [Flavisolibacter sp.]
METYVEKGLKKWQIPGAAVCIIKDGKIILMKGYGFREKEAINKIDINTLFMIGSNTKAFTATALALLEAERKISLDDPVQKWLPSFSLSDPYVSKELTLRDLLSHRTGLNAFQGDFAFFNSDLTQEEIKRKFALMKLPQGIRSRWGYSNAAYLIAADIIEKASGKRWAEYIKGKFLTPLTMKNTVLSVHDIKSIKNAAIGFTVDEGFVKQIPYGEVDNLSPAGCISSSISDMSKWVMMLLNNGKIGDSVIIPPSAILQTQEPSSILGSGNYLFNSGHFNLYGLGWFLEEYSGKKIISHSGGVNGFLTSVTLVPEAKTGIIVLTNTDHNYFYEALRMEILDACLGNSYRNYNKIYKESDSIQQKQIAEWLRKKRDTIASQPKPALPLEAFTGSYNNELYGNMNISLKNRKLIATFEHHKGLIGYLEPLGGNRFFCIYSNPLFGKKVIAFSIDANQVKNVQIVVDGFIEPAPYTFTKKNSNN